LNIRPRDIGNLTDQIIEGERKLAQQRIELRLLAALQGIVPGDLPGYLRVERDYLPGAAAARARLVVGNVGERWVAPRLLGLLPALPAAVAESKRDGDDRPWQHFLADRDPLTRGTPCVRVAPIARYEHQGVWWWTELDAVLVRVEIEYGDEWRAPAIDRMTPLTMRGTLTRPLRPPEADVFSPVDFDGQKALKPVDGSLTPDAVAAWFAHAFSDAAKPRVDRYEVPGIHALNFVLHEALDGGITASPRLDKVAKAMAQQLLEFPVPVPRALAEDSDQPGA